MIEMNVERRWEQGLPHDKRSEEIFRSIQNIDRGENGNWMDLESGGDGDNGEHLMYLMDIHFEMQDLEKECQAEVDSKKLYRRLDYMGEIENG